MSNDIRTLADVQPGGRVRLRDQAERARFEAWGRTEGLPLARGKLGGYAFEITAKAWRAWQYLSAQPSPGVQGDVLAAAAQAVIEAHDGVDFITDAQVESLRAALAARQPVGEPVDAIERIALLLYLRSCNRRADGMPMQEWGPMDEHLKDYYRREARNYEALRNTAPWPAGRKNYAAPAQAVDLADFKALYRAYVRLLESARDRIRHFGGTCDPVDVMEANDVDLQTARRVLDSRAVGNG